MMWLDGIDYFAGLVVGFGLCLKYYQPVLPLKVTTLPVEPNTGFTKWSELLEPHVRKLKLAGLLGMNYTFNPTGSLAMSVMLSEIAMTLDSACAQKLAREKEIQKAP